MPIAPRCPDRQIRAFIEGFGGEFGELALTAFAYQFAQNPPYQRYCRSLDKTPATVTRWEQVPPVPTDVFRSTLPICTFPAELSERVFRTSGTTNEIRGTHHLRDLSLYQASIRSGWADAGLPDRSNAWFLAPPPESTPDSSLGCMFETLCPEAGPSRWLVGPDGSFRLGALREAASRSGPVVLFATALGLLRLTANHPASLPLPAGSNVFQTGGYKGLQREVTPAALYAAITDYFRVPSEHVINEYGMTELCSQAYATGIGTPHHLPPWMRVRAIDPHTGVDLPPHSRGYLVFHDLANLHTVSAIRTQDFGRVIDDGAFFLDGRDPGALPRGCSRTSDAPVSSTS